MYAGNNEKHNEMFTQTSSRKEMLKIRNHASVALSGSVYLTWGHKKDKIKVIKKARARHKISFQKVAYM